MFDAEQAVQLYLKSIILEYTDAAPQTHNLRMLFNSIGELLGTGEEFREFIRRNRYKLHTLEDAYYYFANNLPKMFSRDDAEGLVEFAREVIEFVRSHKANRASEKR